MSFGTTDLSIDIEALGHHFNAPLISIGAVAFDRETGKLGKSYYQEIDIDSAIKSGVVSAGTIAWWIRQNDKPKELFKDTPEALAKKMHIASALQNFSTFYRSLGAPCPWGNGATFDITIIEHAILNSSVGTAVPWIYWKVRDMRTLVETAEMLRSFKADKVRRNGVHHNALDDATHQANVICAAWAALKGNGKPAAPQKPTVDDDEGL